jgi:cytochrome d ubiquinol oxidase subunit I
MLSLLAYNQLTGEVKGINDLQAEYVKTYGPGNYVPPAWITYWSFRLMVGAGGLMLVLAAYALFLGMGEMLERNPPLLKAFLFAIALPYLATTSGWVLTEIGRWPWVVFGLMKIEDAVSPTVTAGMLLVTLIGFTLVYGALMVADVYLLVKFARAGTPDIEAQPAGSPLPSVATAD